MARSAELPRCGQCGKHGFPSQMAVIRAILRRLPYVSGSLRFYECPHHAGLYHMTSQTKRA